MTQAAREWTDPYLAIYQPVPPAGLLDRARVLLVDDTFTTGARAQSAASSPARAGARVVAVLTIGRVIDPDWNDNCREIWRHAEDRPFPFESCCWCP